MLFFFFVLVCRHVLNTLTGRGNTKKKWRLVVSNGWVAGSTRETHPSLDDPTPNTNGEICLIIIYNWISYV